MAKVIKKAIHKINNEIFQAQCGCCKSDIEFNLFETEEYKKFILSYDKWREFNLEKTDQKNKDNFNDKFDDKNKDNFNDKFDDKKLTVTCPECNNKVVHIKPEPVMDNRD
jgi:hypothetical protein